ncbi:MAG TPA: DUF2891 domain-containing protein [Gemmatimonadaceae bacterium]|nr:DUF2891 domain-containing protein [Gemmatimonadaceae bacterium]
MTQLDQAAASKLASLVLAHVRQEYPNKLDHALTGPHDLAPPSVLHPVFYGSFDWHSNVHGYWLLATLYRRLPSLPERARIRSLFDEQLTVDKVAGELAYLNQPSRGAFERPYGWAWLLMLAAELARADSAEGGRWHAALAPLARAFADHFRAFLPKAAYPIRVGTHFNTAFALSLALEYADACDDADLAALVRTKAHAWYGGDRDCQAWEPGGDDFLSPALVEAECMRRVFAPDDWSRWMDGFLPRLASGEPRTLFVPANVSDRSDGKIAHLDGLNLSRAWCWRSIAQGWGERDPRRAAALESANAHLRASLPHVADDYAGSHWLATYALLALLADASIRDS